MKLSKADRPVGSVWTNRADVHRVTEHKDWEPATT